MTWLGAYTSSDKCPAPEKGFGHMRLDSLCTDSEEDHEFLDTLVYIYMYVHDHARIEDYDDGNHCMCTTNYGFPM